MISTKGFTLVELLVVLLILSVLFVATPIAFSRVLPGIELRSDAQQVARLIREARSRAIRNNMDATVLKLTLRTAASERQGADSARIRFFPDGTSTGGRVSLARRDTAYHVEVDWLSGRVRIVE